MVIFPIQVFMSLSVKNVIVTCVVARGDMRLLAGIVEVQERGQLVGEEDNILLSSKNLCGGGRSLEGTFLQAFLFGPNYFSP